MKEGQPSQTAAMVAFLRALAELGVTSAKGFHDPTARHLLPNRWAWFLSLAERRLRKANPTALTAAKHGVDLLALRTLIIDAEVKEALAAGVKQLVILGAGLDGRPYRLAELSTVRVFEVDHPATQAWKKDRVKVFTRAAASVTFVPVNFERDSLDAELERAGHRKDEPTVWIWEGVVMYLTEAALRSTLAVVGARSAAGSSLILNYHTQQRARGMALLLRFWREPQMNFQSPEQMAALLKEAGFKVKSESGVGEWAQRFE
ncbi:MAG: class I SAM-dependent methyltransferase, partial [Myxococcaceae bacterium]